MKILSVPLPVQPLPCPPASLFQIYRPVSAALSSHVGTSKNSFLINLGWKVGQSTQGGPSPSCEAAICTQRLPAGLCLPLWRRHGWRCPSASQQWRNTRELKVLGKAIKKEEKLYGVVWGTMSGFREKKRSRTYQGEEKVSGTHPPLLLGTENVGKINF